MFAVTGLVNIILIKMSELAIRLVTTANELAFLCLILIDLRTSYELNNVRMEKI